jgi:hypothetical protein
MWKKYRKARTGCNKEQIHRFIYGENVNSEMKTTGRKYNKMLERKLWHCSVAVRAAARYITNSTVPPLGDLQHGSLAWSSRETLTADRDWETRCGWRDSRIPAKLESWRDWRMRLATFRSVIGWGYSETRDQNDDGRTKVILGITGKGLGNVQIE